MVMVIASVKGGASIKTMPSGAWGGQQAIGPKKTAALWVDVKSCPVVSDCSRVCHWHRHNNDFDRYYNCFTRSSAQKADGATWHPADHGNPKTGSLQGRRILRK
jgi:hypothetical protein